MKITQLKVTNYRCFQDFHVKDLGKMVCLVGANGSGKSSILDLIVKVCGTKGGFEQFLHEVWDNDVDNETLCIEIELTQEEHLDYNPERTIHPITGSQRFRPVQNFPSPGVGSEKGIDSKFINFVRRRIVAYGASRSFILQDVGDPRLDVSLTEIYRNYNISNFTQRARALSALMTRLLSMQRAELVSRMEAEGDDFKQSSYSELSEVVSVFDKFFRLTGKKFVRPTVRGDGLTAYYFTTPWSDTPIPLSCLSSGEQWLLLFFLEMKLNKWENHIILIDEIEQHLHPKLLLEFVKEIQQGDDNNQYWITTHSPNVANFLRGSTFGLVLNNQYQSDVVTDDSVSLLASLAGHEAVIPVAKTIVLIEGSKVDQRAVSTDQMLFEELREMGCIPGQVQFVSIGHTLSVMDLGQALPDFERELGIGWKIYSIRDRDAMMPEKRDEMIQSQEGRLWIWERSSLEGYLVNPELVQSVLENMRIDSVPSEEAIKSTILDFMTRHRQRIIERFENHLVYLNYPSRGKSTVKWLRDAGRISKELEKEVDRFSNDVDKWLNDGDWEALLPYADCKKLLSEIYGRYTHKGYEEVELVQKTIRDAVRPKLTMAQNQMQKLEEIWPEIAKICKCLINGVEFPI